jgi:uncharacterized membrane protein YphA (DoxX/SURF4 family)
MLLNYGIDRADDNGAWLPRFYTCRHGTAKLLHVPRLPVFDQLRVLSRDGFAGMLKIAGSLLLLLGLFTRPCTAGPLLHARAQRG